MKFSTRTRYGIRAMIEIALNAEVNGVFQKDIAERQNISVKYLDHIIRDLKTAGLIVNAHGKKSGYKLTRKPNEISMLDIHNAFEAGISVIECMSVNVHCEFEKKCKARLFWHELNDKVYLHFKNKILTELIF